MRIRPLVEVLRGGRVESLHAGALVVADDQGRVVLRYGDIGAPVFPRSAVKVIQALPLMESGAAERYGFGDRELALACASHGGEPAHVAVATAMLAAAGRGEADLECGAHWPSDHRSAAALSADHRKPGALHNNCSGKHAGFICFACQDGLDTAGYVRADHPVQTAVRKALEDVTEVKLGDEVMGIDGCSIPTFAMPLKALAKGFARLGTGRGLEAGRASAVARLRAAVAAEPFYVAGTGRFCSEVMALLGARAFVKVGAEGVYCGALPDLGLGFALKTADGASRAAEVATAAVLARYLGLDAAAHGSFARFMTPKLTNWNGIEVGGLRPSAELTTALAAG